MWPMAACTPLFAAAFPYPAHLPAYLPMSDVFSANPAFADDQPERPGDSYVTSFARGLAVIRSFNASRPAQTLSDVAAATGLSRAGARRILLTLQTLGYVESEGRL